MIYQPEIETMGRAEMEALQLKRLQETVAYVYERVPMYKERLDALRVKPEDIQSLDDIRRLPFTVKDDLRDHYPYDLFAVPMKEIVRIHASSGTTGQPTVVGYTRDDLEMWSHAAWRAWPPRAARRMRTSRRSAFGYGLFTGALGLHYGLEQDRRRGGAHLPPATPSGRSMLMTGLRHHRCWWPPPPTPSIMAEARRAHGHELDELKLRIGLFGAEGMHRGNARPRLRAPLGTSLPRRTTA